MLAASVSREGVADAEWDTALLEMNGHFLQSTHWQAVQQALGHRITTRRSRDWMWAAALRSGRFPRYMYIPYGPAARDDVGGALRSAVAAAAEERLDFVRVEPGSPADAAALRLQGAVRRHAVQPRWTWVLDIDRPEEDLRRGLTSGHRAAVNAAPRRGLHMRRSVDPADIEVYIRLQRAAGERSGFAATPDEYHRTVARVLMPRGAAALYIASVHEQPVAASLCYDFGDTRYYASAVLDQQQGRKLRASTPLVWRMVLDARAAGLRHFDFWGVRPHAPPDHPWAGFTRFKMEFGGHLVERAGTWELPVRPLRHRLYRLVGNARRR